MIGENLRNALPFTAASDMNPHAPVQVDTGTPKRQAVAVGTNNVEIQGFTGDATALRTEAVTVYGEGAVVQAVAAASLGAGAELGIASSNGALGPVSGASGVSKYRVGKSFEAAAAGEKFALYVKPKQLSNLI